MITSSSGSSQAVSRIAPTPSGYLHIGNAYNFLFSWLLTKKLGGTLILRIDDLDQQRVRSVFLEDIFRTIDWLGINYDAGPTGPEEHLSQYSQIHRRVLYENAAYSLKDHLYGCSSSRKEIQQHSIDGQYPLSFRKQHLSLEDPQVAWRMLTPEGAEVSWHDGLLGTVSIDLFSTMRDFILRKKDGQVSYQLASLVDDLHMQVNTVCRGRDLLPSSAAQLFLASALGEKNFLGVSFYHHALLTDEEGKKLSKSHQALSMFQTAYSPTLKQRLFNSMLRRLGREVNSVETAEELLKSVSLAEILQLGDNL